MEARRSYVVLGAPKADYPLVFDAILAGAQRAGWRLRGTADAEVFGTVAATDADYTKAALEGPMDRSHYVFNVVVGDFKLAGSTHIGYRVPAQPDEVAALGLSSFVHDFLKRIDNDRAALVRGIDARAALLLDDLGWVLQHQREELLLRVGGLEHRVDLLEAELVGLRAALAEQDGKVRHTLIGGITKAIAAGLAGILAIGAAEIGAGAARTSAQIGSQGQVAAALIGKAPPSVNLSELEDLARGIQKACESQ